MCWWNDFATHRNDGGADGRPRPRQQQTSDAVSPREATDSGAAGDSVHRVSDTSSQHGDIASRIDASGAGLSAGFTSHEETCETMTNSGDIDSLRQASTSAGDVTMSDQFDLSAAFSAWNSPSRQQEQHPLKPHFQLPLLSPAADAVDGLQSSLATGGRRGTEANSGSSTAYGSDEPVGVPFFATDFYTPSFVSGAEGVSASVATYSRGSNFSSTANTINNDNGSVVSGDINKAGKEGVVYDEADVGTISSLIASLQVRGNASPAEADEVANPGDSSYRQHEPPARDSRAPADADKSIGASANPDTAKQQSQPQLQMDPNAVSSNLAPVFHDSNASTSVIACLNTTQGSIQYHSSSMYSGNTSGNILCCNTSCSSGCEVPLEETLSGAITSSSKWAGSGASLRYQGDETDPLKLTPSNVHIVLTSFQCVPGEHSSGVTQPNSIGDPCDTTGRGTGSHNDGSSSGDTPVKMDAPAMTGSCSSAMRGCASSVAAYTLNLDGTTRRSGLQDLRGNGSFPRAGASPDSSCCSDIPTSVPSAQGGLSLPPQVYTQERDASPDSSVDHFAQATSYVPSVLGLHQQMASSVTTEPLGATHHHLRTASEVSLSTAAATYSGDNAQQQRADDSGCIAVVDPQRRKLRVPLSAIQVTKALNGRLKTPSLCLLYQSGRCRQSENCYQVHVDPAMVERLRADVKNMPCCCFRHGDCNSHLMDRKVYEERSLRIAGRFSVPLTSVAYTSGLQRVLQDQQACPPVNPSVLCRLHGQPGGCRFAADCRFVHICCEILQHELAGIMANVVAASAASAALTAAPQKQQQSWVGKGLPFSVDLANSGSISSSFGTVHGDSNAATLSANNAVSSVMSAAEFSPSQVSRPVTVSPTAALNALSMSMSSSSQQQRPSTPSAVTMQPPPCAGTLSAPCVGPHYTLTALPPLVSQVQSAAARPSPLQTSVHGSPPLACQAHVHTLSTQSNGTYPSYAALTVAQTPSLSEAASPMNMGLPVAHSSSTIPVATAATAGCIGGALPSLAQRRFPRQTAPPQLHQPSSLVQPQPPQFLRLPQHYQPSTSQQFYIQQINPDGTISLVPVSVMQDFSRGVF
ncbi:hypothetical protein CUR178_03365 [Leishmania enriettii]|uniref:C3H1-type domain-containing protein n=1 Tax=Leishmania enriettii TaxID=5663 RepID=A0A836GV01_LEIEN|nr:hypothetical protein CUR178_03365 [Leishmania enriettii]